MKISIDVNGKGPSLGDFYGIFFEDINHAADGGLYAQMVQNPSFEFCALDNKNYNALTAWEATKGGDILVRQSGGCLSKNPNFCEIAALEAGGGIRNLGYGKGMYLSKGKQYRLSFFGRGAMPIRITLESAGGAELASECVTMIDDWNHYNITLTPSATIHDGALAFRLGEAGRIALDAVELFPAETYKNGPWRKDISEALEELKPRFMRFPGGCLVHDGSLDPDARDSCYCWKNTIGAADARPARRNNWGYNQTLGLGYYEYFLLCEHFGCEPLPVLPAGWNPHRQEACPLDQMQPWIDDALDLIEFANGGMDTVWGTVRGELGHPEPFNLKYLAIGNEEVGPEFPPRYSLIAAAVKEKYPEIKLIHSAGPFSAGSEYERGYSAARADGAELIDEHYYCSPQWFLANVHRYDDFPAEDPKVFLGEYASWGNTYYNAVVEAAYMTGLENAAHAVALTCYAPLLCHVDYVNWRPDLIWFDNSRLCKTPNYYVQKLFSNNLADHIIPVDKSEIKVFPAENLPISGRVEIVSDGAEGWIWDVKLTNLRNNDSVNFGNFDVTSDFKTTLSEINLTEFELSLNFKKGGGRSDKGIFINFGKNGDENLIRWEVGGWQNQDCLISSNKEGRGSCLDQHIFRVETGVEYNLRLQVHGRKITTIINDVVMNSCEDKLPDIESAYITAGKIESTGEIIVKAVNVRHEDCPCVFDLGGGSYSGTVYSLSGHSADAENTLDEETVSPKEEKVSFNGELEYTLPPLSVAVIRVR